MASEEHIQTLLSALPDLAGRLPVLRQGGQAVLCGQGQVVEEAGQQLFQKKTGTSLW